MMRRTFASRIGWIVVLSLSIAWIGSIAIFYVSMNRDGREVRPLPGQIAALVALVERSPAQERQLVLRAVTSDRFVARIEPGLNVGDTPSQRVPRAAARAVNNYLEGLGGRAVSVSLSAAHGEPRLLSRFISVAPVDLQFRIGLDYGATLVVDTRSSPVASLLGLPIGFVAGLFGTVIGFVALIVMQRETKPLAHLAAAVDRIDLAGSPVLLPQAGSGAQEIRALIEAFNRLQSRLSQLLRARMAMLGGISHDVRSFATRLRLRIEQLPEGADRDRANADIADMIRLLDDALLASRAGAGELTQELVEFDQVVRAEVSDRVAEGKSVDLLAGFVGDAVVLGDRLALRRVVANLVDNALQYGRVAHIKLDADEHTTTLIVDDEGTGIPPEQREAMLEPFARLETSRSRRTGGAGLGLAVVRNLVEAHDGIIAIADAPGGGARFTVKLPLFRA
ncbi:MAG TPA: HAMP domain-containing sensor histidine kinase [Steroidobacteraceae bacterium]|jgi:signal transduction histidine kinase